jgi:protease IV
MDNQPLEKQLVDGLLNDRKKDRRWRNIRFFVVIIFIVLYSLAIFMGSSMRHKQAGAFDAKAGYVALIRLNGAIAAGKPFSADAVVPQLNRAFRDKEAKGVVLVINSPGGSPVQAGIIHDKIMQLKKKFHKTVIVLGVDSLASGAYLVAVAADKIYVHPDTLTGSIGVLMSGFGFTDAIKKLGITRRVFTSGENKVRLDHFEPVTAQSREKIQRVLNEVHKNFIQYVVKGRKGRLHGNSKELFSGDFWTGSQAVKLGLVDGTGNLWTILENNFQVDQYKNYSHRPSFLSNLVTDLKSEIHFSLENHTTVKEEM